MFGLGTTELIIILVLVMIIFGAGKLPDIATGLGKGLKDFKKAMQEPEESDTREPPEDPPDETPPSSEKRKDA